MQQLYWLLVGHMLCDYPLQGDFLAKAKNHLTPIPGIPWIVCLLAHAMIHGASVAYITQSIQLGLAETAAHLIIDHIKCDQLISFLSDQVLHILCKVVWVMVVYLESIS